MEHRKNVSIIIPVYNAEKYIAETIENIKKQTYKNYEIILINDASTDKSVEIIKKYLSETVKLIQLKENCGPAIARNRGIQEAKGRYICFQDADDLWHEQKLEKQLRFMEEKNCAFSYTAFDFTNEAGIRKGKNVNVPPILEYKEALKNIKIITFTVMFDTTKISKQQIYMPNVKSEDIATWWAILKKGYIAYGLNEVLAYYRRGHKTLSSNKLIWQRNRWNLYRKTEKLPFFHSCYYFCHYMINGIIKRI